MTLKDNNTPISPLSIEGRMKNIIFLLGILKIKSSKIYTHKFTLYKVTTIILHYRQCKNLLTKTINLLMCIK